MKAKSDKDVSKADVSGKVGKQVIEGWEFGKRKNALTSCTEGVTGGELCTTIWSAITGFK